VALIFAWFLVLRANWWEWSLNPQYSYGTLVPILALLLLARRWCRCRRLRRAVARRTKGGREESQEEGWRAKEAASRRRKT